MSRSRIFFEFLALLLLATALPALAAAQKPLSEDSGSLAVFDKDGKETGQCPLEGTKVAASISGFFAEVEVTQTFKNPFPQKIEAVYTFPLPENAAVYRMVMKIKDRVVKGEIKRKEEARKIYEEARERGQVASLLDQERPNIFTQSVANIEPNATIEISISYLDVLPYKNGLFTFAFPTVVGPRYNPLGKVPDEDRISPPIVKEGKRAGHNIGIAVKINAGMKIVNLKSELHEVNVDRSSDAEATVTLVNKDEIPNRDFILTYEVAEDAIKSGIITHRGEDGEGYFTLILIPPKKIQASQIQPKEMIYIVDRSGSQSGLPIEKAKETLLYILDHMNAGDTFQLIDFSNGYNRLFNRPMPQSEEMVKKAKEYINTIDGNGGTEMAAAVEAACKEPAEEGRLRIVTLMTDAFIGNDFEVVKLVKELRGKSRWFPFGTGNSVNSFLIDKIAAEGGGEPEHVLLNSDAETVGKSFWEKIRNPVLTDIALSFEGIKVDEVYPNEPSDLWDRKPIVLKGRFEGAGKGTVILRGNHGGKPYEERIAVTFPEREDGNGQIRQIWARAKVDALMSKDWMVGQETGGDSGERKALKEQIIGVALKFALMTQFTSFVAVEETYKTEGGKPVRVDVPVEMPEGVSYDGVFGSEKKKMEQGAVPMGGASGAAYSKSMPSSSLGAADSLRETESLAPGAPAQMNAPMAPPPPSPIVARGRRGVVGFLPDSEGGETVIYPEFGAKPGDKTPKPVAPIAGPAGLSDELKALLAEFKAGKLDEKAATVKIEIAFDALSAEVKAKIKALAVRVVFSGAKKMVVEAHAKHLEELAGLAGVTSITKFGK